MFVNLHTHNFTKNSDVIEIINQYPNEFSDLFPQYSIGIHPWYIPESYQSYLDIIESKMQDSKCLAIGECGLDKRIEISLDKQIEIFEKQLILAQKYNKPVILHLVGAFQELIEIKKRLKITVPLIVHGFSGSKELSDQLIKHDFYISFGKYLLRNKNLEIVFKNIPNDKFFLETDTTSDQIDTVYNLASRYKNVTLHEIKEIVLNNYKTVFKNG